MKILSSTTFSLLGILLFGQAQSQNETIKEYYDDGSLKMIYQEFNGQRVDTLKAYDTKGRIKTILFFGEYGATDPIYKEDYYSGASRKTTGYYYMESGKEPRNVGVQKTFWKNGALMDSVVYDSNGVQVHRARFGKNGDLQWENER